MIKPPVRCEVCGAIKWWHTMTYCGFCGSKLPAVILAVLLAGCASLPPPEEVAKTCPDNQARNGWHDGFEWFTYATPAKDIRYSIVEPHEIAYACPRYAGFTTHACFRRPPGSSICWITLARGYTREHVCHEHDHCRGKGHK